MFVEGQESSKREPCESGSEGSLFQRQASSDKIGSPRPLRPCHAELSRGGLSHRTRAVPK